MRGRCEIKEFREEIDGNKCLLESILGACYCGGEKLLTNLIWKQVLIYDIWTKEMVKRCAIEFGRGYGSIRAVWW